MRTLKCSAAMLIAILLLPSVAVSADEAQEAYEKGMSCLGKNDYDAAITAFTESLRLDPKNIDAYYRRGMAYEVKGVYDNAITDFTEAIRLNPRFSQVYCERGNAFDGKGEHDKAIADYTEAIRLNPKSSMTYYNRGITFERKGDYDKAIADFTVANRLNPRSKVLVCRGTAYVMKGDYDAAITDCNVAIWFDPKLAEAYGCRGTAYDKKGDHGRAIADFDKGIQLDSKNAVSHNGLAWLRATCSDGRFRDGQRAIDHATRACELTQWKYGGYIGTLAAAYAEAGKFDKAVEFQRKAVEMAIEGKEKDEMRERLNLYRDGKPYREPVKKK